MVSNIYLLISWNIYSTYIILFLGIIDNFFGTTSFMDTLVFGNLAQLVLHYVFSFWFRLYGGSFACISYIVLTKDYCNFSSFQSATNFFLIDYLSLNICSSITLLLVMAILTSAIWTQGLTTLGSTTYGFSTVFTPLFLNIFCILLYLGQPIICPIFSPQIW